MSSPTSRTFMRVAPRYPFLNNPDTFCLVWSWESPYVHLLQEKSNGNGKSENTIICSSDGWPTEADSYSCVVLIIPPENQQDFGFEGNFKVEHSFSE